MVKKIFVFIAILGLFLVGIPQFNLKAHAEEHLPSYSDKNLAIPDLSNAISLGYGDYELKDDNGRKFLYNVYNGVFSSPNAIIENSPTRYVPIYFDTVIGQEYTISLYNLSYEENNWRGFPGLYSYENNLIHNFNTMLNQQVSTFTFIAVETSYHVRLSVNVVVGQEYGFKAHVQIEKGDTSTTYTVPLQPYLWYEKQLSYDDGFSDGYDEGLDYGYEDGYNDGTYDYAYWDFSSQTYLTAEEYGLIQYNDGVNDAEVSSYADGVRYGYANGLDDGYDDGYEVGRAEFAYENVNGSWLSAEIYGNIRYADGYRYGSELGYDGGYYDGEIFGYNRGLNETDATGFNGLLTAIFSGLSSLLGIEILPGIYIGAIFAVPLVFGIIYFILGKKKE